jgi:hypothetical protein
VRWAAPAAKQPRPVGKPHHRGCQVRSPGRASTASPYTLASNAAATAG